jgi:hypothetical protein
MEKGATNGGQIELIFIVVFFGLWRGAEGRTAAVRTIYRVSINYRRILQNNIFRYTEQKYVMLLPFERAMFAVS